MRASRLAVFAGLSALAFTMIGLILTVELPAAGIAAGVGAAAVLGIGLFLGLEAVTGAAVVLAVSGILIGDVANFTRSAAGAMCLAAAVATARICMDARRPAVVSIETRRHLALAPLTVAAAAAAAALVGAALTNNPPGRWLVPIAVIAASTPLFVRPGSRHNGLARTSAAVVGAAIVGALVVAGAQSQTTPAPQSSAPTATADEPAELVERVLEENETAESRSDIPEYMAAMLVLVLGVMLLGLLRKSLSAEQPMEFKPTTVIPDDGDLTLVDHRMDMGAEGAFSNDDAADIIAATLRALDTISDPRRAIRLAYATLERGFGDLDIARGQHESETEYLSRLRPLLPGAAGAMEQFTALFEAARYSAHDIDDAQRAAAVAAFYQVRLELTAPAANGGAT
ncbi:MAG: hypothetical protein ACI91O_001662 [Candidatus Poriferisodalaceae bacterium]|jgi:hypothetical protein